MDTIMVRNIWTGVTREYRDMTAVDAVTTAQRDSGKATAGLNPVYGRSTVTFGDWEAELVGNVFTDEEQDRLHTLLDSLQCDQDDRLTTCRADYQVVRCEEECGDYEGCTLRRDLSEIYKWIERLDCTERGEAK